ncbi:MAG TPA: hypothetical protein VIJ46_01505, partial [Rhabdochlamydiaceae bacterium]
IFKSSPLFTPLRKWKIVHAADAYRDYLKDVGFDIPKRTPPLGVSDGLIGGAVGGDIYNSGMMISKDQLNHPRTR